jgi:ABC-type sugar transport system ATPase subunit
VVYISHRLPEIMQIADRVTVLRDGQVVCTHPITDLTPDAIIEMMVGRKLADLYPERAQSLGNPVLTVEGLAHDGRLADISFILRRGEIVGIAGLMGSRRGDVLRALVGVLRTHSGTIKLDNAAVRIQSPEHAFALGIAYLPEDRKNDGLFLNMPVRQNISVTALHQFARWGLMNPAREATAARRYIEALRIRTPDVHQPVGRLSGGNQQKVMLAKWLARKPHVLLIDEPTKGVDVGAKVEIHALLRQLANGGAGIIFVSSDFPELIGLADRILVIHEGRLVGDIPAARATEQNLMLLSSGYRIEEAAS